MSRDWEETFRSWAKAPGTTEQTKCENAESAICKAITQNPTFKNRSVKVFPQGSYRNRTNVRIESDVDICTMCSASIFFHVPAGMSASDFNLITPAPYTYSEYKKEVGGALALYFGAKAVTPGKKAFDVHENSYRVDADCIACFEYRSYSQDGTYLQGTAFLPDGSPTFVVNWPDQQYNNGVAKNDATGRRFKSVVRIVKHLRNEMEENGYRAADPISSFLIECLVWNVPNSGFGHATYGDDVRYALAHTFNNTRDEQCQWKESNGLKGLFETSQPWSREQVNAFLGAAWGYVGFK